ncbi:MAG TPA: VOC family protein [Gammaproteobacteria bacterium]|nr:VOC family protein [Gammaproteobacteria bacterium]
MPESSETLPRLVGLNHIALEVGDVEDALTFYGKLFDINLRGRGDGRAFIDMGDQFIALFEGGSRVADDHRHIGLVVDNKAAVRERLDQLRIKILSDRFLDFRDPWGNRIQIIDYADIQFTKAPAVLKGMGLDGLEKSDDAKQQLRDKGMAPT